MPFPYVSTWPGTTTVMPAPVQRVLVSQHLSTARSASHTCEIHTASQQSAMSLFTTSLTATTVLQLGEGECLIRGFGGSSYCSQQVHGEVRWKGFFPPEDQGAPLPCAANQQDAFLRWS